MSVLIKDMEMPETCDDCPFHVYHSHNEYVCKATPLFYPMNLANSKGIRKDWCPLSDAPDINVGTSKYMVSATAVEEMLKDLLPERGMWEIEGDEAKNAICETVHDALEGLWKLPSAQPEIIHCCDCKYSSKDMIFDEYFCSKKTRSNCVAEDHYCGYAERWEE